MTMTAEVWLPVVGYEGYFEVSSQGRVRSMDRVAVAKNGRRTPMKGRVLSTFARSGYRYVHLKVNGVDHKTGVHQLVCEAFHGTPLPTQPEARHKDGTRDNNISSNLEWGTVSQNKDDMVRHGRHHNANKVKCKYGHKFDEENTIVTLKCDGRTRRTCRKCKVIYETQRRAAAA